MIKKKKKKKHNKKKRLILILFNFIFYDKVKYEKIIFFLNIS